MLTFLPRKITFCVHVHVLIKMQVKRCLSWFEFGYVGVKPTNKSIVSFIAFVYLQKFYSENNTFMLSLFAYLSVTSFEPSTQYVVWELNPRLRFAPLYVPNNIMEFWKDCDVCRFLYTITQAGLEPAHKRYVKTFLRYPISKGGNRMFYARKGETCVIKWQGVEPCTSLFTFICYTRSTLY